MALRVYGVHPAFVISSLARCTPVQGLVSRHVVSTLDNATSHITPDPQLGLCRFLRSLSRLESPADWRARSDPDVSKFVFVERRAQRSPAGMGPPERFVEQFMLCRVLAERWLSRTRLIAIASSSPRARRRGLIEPTFCYVLNIKCALPA